ncbi:hypothetical protein Cgig2_013663 [Carnegiea gigantea]|uniref:Uncharacterized protein n=1 Tax=Carnegiea gigantea TaxID=171969 RepID=A0A9Q1GYE0_9CARY|nr:hypothetical protein Cgig2_013663 [Carnegiea gigantea]
MYNPLKSPKKKKKADKKRKTNSNNNEELNSKRHAVLDNQTEKEKKKEELPNQPVHKVAKKRKPSKDPADKPLSKKAKRDKFPLESGKDEEPAQKSVAKVEDNKKSSKQIAAKNAPRDDEAHQKSAKKCEHKEKHLQKAPTKLENKEKGRSQNNQKSMSSEGKAIQKGHVSDVGPSNCSNSEENDSTYEYEEEELALKSEEGASGKRTYQKAFITRMSMHSFSSLVAQLNEAQAEAVRSMGFASFLKVDVKQIPRKFSKHKFSAATFSVYAILGVPLGGTETIEITKSSTDEDKSILKYVKDVSHICQFILDKLIMSVKNYKESTATKGAVIDPQTTYVEYQNLQLKQKANNGLCAPSFSPILSLYKPDGEAETSRDTLVFDASIIIEKEEHCEDVLLD